VNIISRTSLLKVYNIFQNDFVKQILDSGEWRYNSDSAMTTTE